jgi:hypothetical protein
VPFGGEGGAGFFATCHFGLTHIAASAGVFVAAELVVGFGDGLGELDGFASLVERDEGEVGAGDVAEAFVFDVFDHGFDADLHGGVEGAVDAGFEDKDVADVDWSYEVDVVHGDGDGDAAGVAAGGHGTDEVDELEQAAPEEVAEGVRVAGEDDLGALGLGGADGAGLGCFGHGSIVWERVSGLASQRVKDK